MLPLSHRERLLLQPKRYLYDFYQIPWEGTRVHGLDKDFVPTDQSYGYRMMACMDMIEESSESSLSILDAGCGVGIHTVNIAKKYENAEVIGLDISFAQVKLAREVAQRAGVSDRTFFFQADIETAALKREFDYIICSEVIEHLPVPSGGIDNLLTLASPRTAVLITVPNHYPLHGIVYKQMRKNGYVQESLDDKELDQTGDIYPYIHKTYNLQEICELLHERGVEIETWTGVAFNMPGYISRLMGLLHFRFPRSLSGIMPECRRRMDRFLSKLLRGRFATSLVLKCRKGSR